jgi:hypothetical protein
MQLDELLDGVVIQTSADLSVYSSTADKKYDQLMKCWNVTSYSQRQLLHACPRKYQLAMHEAAQAEEKLPQEPNLDFTFGHAVGAGVQSWLLDGNLAAATLNAMMAWRAPFDARSPKKRKSLWEAVRAIELFADWWQSSELGDEWELARLPNGKPAIELAFSLHARSGFKDYGHIDIVLRNRRTGRYAVLELKTTSGAADEAQYANSDQATGYSLMLPTIWEGIQDYTVYYCVFESTGSRWQVMPFDKTVRDRAEWIKSLLLDHSAVATYEDIGFYPKRGGSCFNFRRRCTYFGTCNMVPDGKLPALPDSEEAEPVDAVILLEDVIAELKAEKERKL